MADPVEKQNENSEHASEQTGQLQLAKFRLRIEDKNFIDAMVLKLREHPDQLDQSQKNTIKALILTQLAQSPATEGMDFNAWCATVSNPQLRQIIDASRVKNSNLLLLSGMTWGRSQQQAKGMADTAADIVDSMKTGAGKAMKAFNDWSQENPALAVAALLGGAYACSKIIGKVVGDGIISKSLRYVGGTIVAGRILQLEAVKDLIYRQLGVKVDDWRLARALQDLGSLEFSKALKEILGADPNETTAGDLERKLFELDKWLIADDGMADVVFGKENFEHGMKTRVLPMLQNMQPPRIDPSKTMETLSREERIFVIRYALQHSGQIPQQPGKPTGKKYEEVKNKEFVDDIDGMLGELQKAKAAIEAKSGEDVLTFIAHEIEGMTRFGEFIGTLDQQTRKEVGNQMKQQILGNFEGFFQVKNIFDAWKHGDPQMQALPTAIAGQIMSLKEVFGKYVGNVREIQSAHRQEKLWKWITAVVAVSIVACGGIAVMKVAGAIAIRLIFRVGVWGLRGLAALGPLGIPVAIVVAAAAYTGWRYFDSREERARRRGRSPEDWIAFAQSQVLNEEDYIPKLYELAYLNIDQIAWTSNAKINEFFGAEFEGSEKIELIQCREFILKAAVIAQLRTPGFSPDFSAAKEQQYRDRAFVFLEQQYGAKNYAPNRGEEAAKWVKKALRYATLLDDQAPSEALRMINQDIQTDIEKTRRDRLLSESRENPTSAIEPSLHALTSIDRRATLSLAFDLYQLKEIRSDRTLIRRVPGYQSDRALQYEQDFGVITDHLHMVGADGGMETRMLQGAYGELKAMIEHSDLVGNPENRWSTMANAEVARLSIFMELYQKYDRDREVLGLASHATQLLKKMYFENSPEIVKLYFAAGRRIRAPIDAGRLNDRLGWYREGVKTIWTVLPEFLERMKGYQDARERLGLSYDFLQRLIAEQASPDGDRSLKKARYLMEIVLSQAIPLPNISEKKDRLSEDAAANLASIAQRHLAMIEGKKYDQLGRRIVMNIGVGGELIVESSGFQQRIIYDREKNIYQLGKMEFEPATHGAIQAIMAASKINDLCKQYKDVSFEAEAIKEDKRFYMNDWMGVYIAESSSIDSLVVPQQELYYLTLDKDSFLSTLNAFYSSQK